MTTNAIKPLPPMPPESSDDLQRIQFEGCDVCVIAPEDFDALRSVCEAYFKALRDLQGAVQAIFDSRSYPWGLGAEFQHLREVRAQYELPPQEGNEYLADMQDDTTRPGAP